MVLMHSIVYEANRIIIERFYKFDWSLCPDFILKYLIEVTIQKNLVLLNDL